MVEQTIQDLDNLVLDSIVRESGEGARQAFEELTGRAFGGNRDAQGLVRRLDSEFSSGTLTLSPEESKPQVKPHGLFGRLNNIINQLRPTDSFLPPDRDP